MSWHDDEMTAALLKRPLLLELPHPTDRNGWLGVRYARARRLAARVGVRQIHIDTAYHLARAEAERIEVETGAVLTRRENFRGIVEVIDEVAPLIAAAYERLLTTQYRALVDAATTAIRAGARELQTRRVLADTARALTPPAPPHLLPQALWAATNAERWNARWLNSRRAS